MPGEVLIFVFAGVSYSRTRLILAEFAPVPNAPSDVVPPSAPDVKSAAGSFPRRTRSKLAVRRGRNLLASAIGKRMAAASISKV